MNKIEIIEVSKGQLLAKLTKGVEHRYMNCVEFAYKTGDLTTIPTKK